METEVQQETVTFYHSAGVRAKAAGGGAYPSSMIVRISGGDRFIGENGIAVKRPMKEAIFHNGVFQTDDPETIAVLRKLSKKDPALTEDYESYAGAVLTQDQQLLRTNRKSGEVMQENSRLKQKLAELEKKK